MRHYMMNEPPHEESETEGYGYDEKEDQTGRDRFRKIKWILIVLVVSIIVIVAGSLFLSQYREAKRQEEALSSDDVVEYLVEGETTYSDYLRLFERHGVKGPAVSFVYNVEVPESERGEIDPFWNDVYLGYEENQNLSVSLFHLEDNNVLIIYNTDTDIVQTIIPWMDDVDQDLSLKILQKKGEKAELTKRASETENEHEREQLVKEIKQLNEELMELFDELTQTLPY